MLVRGLLTAVRTMVYTLLMLAIMLYIFSTIAIEVRGGHLQSVRYYQGPPNGGVSNGGVSRSGLVLPFLSFFVLFGTFPIFAGFSQFARGWSRDFPDSSRFSFSAY